MNVVSNTLLERVRWNSTASQALVIAASITVLTIFAGCGTPQPRADVRKSSFGSFVMPQSHFTYPNSNVIPLGHARGTAKAHGDNNNFPDFSAAVRTAMDQAIASKSGADMLINVTATGTLSTKTQSDGRGGVDIQYELDMVVDGTAAKMEIGRQQLK